ncbi:MAG: hypothetical protein MUC69_08440 [Gemmatimonadales bacterium]|jgi:hypothetical protein|nr:hypothetical protein [Gemmatimonadales bacterium]
MHSRHAGRPHPLTTLVALATLACSASEPADIDNGTPPDNGGTGNVRSGLVSVDVVVTGAPLDTDGFDLRVDGRSWRRVATTQVRFSLPVGRHLLSLSGLAAGCESVAGEVEVQVSDAAPVEVELPVRCRGAILRWRAEAMVGEFPDQDGYQLQLFGEGAPAATLTVAVLPPTADGFVAVAEGSYGWRFAKLAQNCTGTIDGGASVTVTDGDTVDVVGRVTCTRLPAGGIVFSDGKSVYRLYEPWGEPVLIERDGRRPRWSLAADRIVFSRDGLFPEPDGYGGTWLAPGAVAVLPDGTADLRLGSGSSYHPQFLPDGRVWLGSETVAGDGAPAPSFSLGLPDFGYAGYYLDLSADASGAAFVAYDYFGGNELLVQRLGGPGPRSIVRTVLPEEFRGARLSPDGLRVAVGTSSATFAVNVDGSGRVELPAGVTPLAWSPDAARLLVTRWNAPTGAESLEVLRVSDGATLATIPGSYRNGLSADWR